MKLYAERPSRTLVQIIGDLLTAAWIAGWIWLGLRLHDLLDQLGQPAGRVSRASDGLADSLAGTGEQIRSIQLIGDLLAQPFDAIISSAQELASAGASSQQTLGRIADLSVPLVALFPVLFAITLWLVLRGRWIRRASAAARLRDSESGEGLLAALALTSTRLDRLSRAGLAEDPLSDARSRQRLAGYALRDLGLRSPSS